MHIIKKIIRIVILSIICFFSIIFYQNCSEFYLGEEGNFQSNNEGNNTSFSSKINYCNADEKEVMATLENIVQISKAQYINIISDLIPTTYMADPKPILDTISKLPSQFPSYGFYGFSQGLLKKEQTEIFIQVSEEVSNLIINDSSIQKLCISKENKAWTNCAKPIIDLTILNLFRRPIRKTEENHFYNQYKAAHELATNNAKDISPLANNVLTKIEADALKTILSSLLISNSFLYKTEFSENGFNADENNYKLISILAFSLLNSSPDAALFKLASSKKTITAKDLTLQTERILKEKPNRFITNFLQHWIGLKGKVLNEAKTGNIALESYLVFKEQLRINQNVEELLKPGFTFVNSYLSNVYELPSKSTGLNDFVKVASIRRGGIPVQSVIIQSDSEQTNPISRGVWAISTLLCRELPLLDSATRKEIEEVMATIPPGITAAEMVELHRAQPQCKSCHIEIDPIGLTFEEIDWKGKWRTRYPSGDTIKVDQVLGNSRITKYEDVINYMNDKQLFGSCLIKKLKSYSFGTNPRAAPKCKQPNDQNINKTGIRSLITEVISLGIIENYK